MRLFCPFAHCTQHAKSDKPLGWTTSRLARDHLNGVYKEELYRLTDEQLEASEIYLCRQCDDYIAVDVKQLEKYVESKHVAKRSDTNHEIVSKHLYPPVECTDNNHWEEGLFFLRNHPFKPPPFWQSLITSIYLRLEDSVLKAFF